MKLGKYFQNYERASILCVILFFIMAAVAPFIKSYFLHNAFSCLGINFTTPIFIYIPHLIIAALPVAAVIFYRRNLKSIKEGDVATAQRKARLKFTAIFLPFIVLGFSWVILFAFAEAARELALFGKTGSDLKIIETAQKMYYQKNGHYADTQAQLVGEGFLKSALVKSYTDKEYADADGSGIEGGDSDPQTWYVRGEIYESLPLIYTTEICGQLQSKPEPKSYYYCDQTGCGNISNNIPQKITRPEKKQ